jgi:hypothetical protein
MHERRQVVTDHEPVAVDEEGRVIRSRDAEVTTAREIAPGRVLAVIAGAVLTIIGAVVLVRTGIDSSLQTPSTQLLGASHNAIAGIVEVVTGLLLLLAGASRDQTMAALPAVLLAAAGIVALAAGPSLRDDLGAQTSTGWFLIVFAIISFVCAAMPIAHRMQSRREIT